MTSKKGIIADLTILEQLPVKIELRLLLDRFAHYKHPRKKVFDLAKSGLLELVVSGHYLNLKSQLFKQTPIESLANAIYFPSYISAEWALQYYGLLTDRVYTITSVTTKKSKRFQTSIGEFEFHHLHKHRYPFGYEVNSNGFFIARPEKALLDYLSIRNHLTAVRSSFELDKFFHEHLRIDIPALQQQITVEAIKELMQHYHRNAIELRILKWLLKKKETANE